MTTVLRWNAKKQPTPPFSKVPMHGHQRTCCMYGVSMNSVSTVQHGEPSACLHIIPHPAEPWGTAKARAVGSGDKIFLSTYLLGFYFALLVCGSGDRGSKCSINEIFHVENGGLLPGPVRTWSVLNGYFRGKSRTGSGRNGEFEFDEDDDTCLSWMGCLRSVILVQCSLLTGSTMTL